VQQNTNFRIKKNRLLRNERKTFMRKLQHRRFDRWYKETRAVVHIQAWFRGFRARQRLLMQREGIESAEYIRTLRRIRRREGTGDKGNDAKERERRFYEVRAVSVFGSGLKLSDRTTLKRYRFVCHRT
jgi:hypothetical protein